MNQLNNKQIRHLKHLAHALKPVVIIGDKGLTSNVVEETKLALETHELIKVKIRAEDKESRQDIIDKLLKQTDSNKIQTVGHIISIFKRSKKLLIALPK